MSTTLIPRACWICLISARTSRWVEASSAVEGSSAMRTRGPRASAAAMATRCRIPPDNWNGYCPATAGSLMPTSASLRTASRRRSARVRRRPGGRDSAIIWPHRIIGWSIVKGSWRIIAISPPRTARRSLALAVRRFDPVVADLADCGHPWREQAHDRPGRHRLAAAGLADDPDRLADSQPQVHRRDDRARTAIALPGDMQVPNLENGRRRGRLRPQDIRHRASPRAESCS